MQTPEAAELRRSRRRRATFGIYLRSCQRAVSGCGISVPGIRGVTTANEYKKTFQNVFLFTAPGYYVKNTGELRVAILMTLTVCPDILMSVFEKHAGAEILRVRPGDIIFCGTNAQKEQIYFLKKGRILVKNVTGRELLYAASAPFFIGLSFLFHAGPYFYIESESECEFRVLDSQHLERALGRESEGWRQVAAVISDILRQQSAFRGGKKHTYQRVRRCIQELETYSESERNKISVYRFIMDREDISRSAIYKIIHELEVGGYITTRRGKLRAVLSLPQYF